MSKQNLAQKKEQSLFETYMSTRIECECIENTEGIPVIQSIIIGGKKIALNEIKEIETVNLFFDAIAEVGGGLDPHTTIHFIAKTASNFPGGLSAASFDRAVALLQKMKPQDPVEARLLAQHFVLHEQGMKYLNLCNNTDLISHCKYFGMLAMKMLKLSQESILALTKYRNKGTQQINIVHMQDNAKAVMVGDMNKNGNRPNKSSAFFIGFIATIYSKYPIQTNKSKRLAFGRLLWFLQQ